MSRPSKASLSVVPFSGRTRLKAPAYLPDRERKVFEMVISTTDADHFRRSDEPLLTRYCEAVVMAEIAMEELRLQGPASGLLQVHDRRRGYS